jgi:hypothetical protein
MRAGVRPDRTDAFVRVLDLDHVEVSDDGRVDETVVAQLVAEALKALPEFAAGKGSGVDGRTHGVEAGRARGRRHRDAAARPDPFAGMRRL